MKYWKDSGKDGVDDWGKGKGRTVARMARIESTGKGLSGYRATGRTHSSPGENQPQKIVPDERLGSWGQDMPKVILTQ